MEKANPSSPYGVTYNGWENITIESYLEAAIAWAEDSQFGEKQNINENIWYKFATFMYCGKIYE